MVLSCIYVTVTGTADYGGLWPLETLQNMNVVTKKINGEGGMDGCDSGSVPWARMVTAGEIMEETLRSGECMGKCRGRRLNVETMKFDLGMN